MYFATMKLRILIGFLIGLALLLKPTSSVFASNNYAISLDGQSSYGTIPSFPLVGYNNSGDWSVEFRWYDPFSNGLPSQDFSFFEWNSSTPIVFSMTSSGHLAMYTEGVWYTSPNAFNFSQGWHSIYVARKGGIGVHTGYFGVDGQVQTVTSPVSFAGTGDFIFGHGTNGYAPGLFDDLYISNRAQHLGNYDPSAIYTADGNTEAVFYFNEGSGSTAHDSTSNNFQMSLTNVSWSDITADWSISLDGQTSYGTIPSLNMVGYNNSGDWGVEFKWYDPFQNGLPPQDFNFFEWNNQSVIFKMTSTGHLAMFTEGVWYTSLDPFNFSQGWHYIYVARKGGIGVHNGYFGVDGIVQPVTSPVSLTGTGDFHFGRGPDGFTSGLLDDLHISSRAQHTSNYSPTENYTINAYTEALFRFDEGYGNKASDSTANNFFMTLYNIGWSNVPQYVNQAPIINAIPDASILQGDTYAYNSSFSDPDSTSWNATVDYGDGSGTQQLFLDGTNFSLNHTYTNYGEFTVTVSVTDNQGATGQDTATIAVVRSLSALSPARVWVGLKNSDSVGIKFDFLAEVYKDGSLVSSGQIDSAPGGSSGFNNARLNTIPFNTFSPVAAPVGTQVDFKVYVRNACTGSGQNSGSARLWFNDSVANSQFDATVGGINNNYYLVDGFTLLTTPGVGPKEHIDIAAGAKCSPFKLFGTWSTTL